MPTKRMHISVYLSGPEHLEAHKKAAAAGLSLSNWLRASAGFEPLKQGGLRVKRKRRQPKSSPIA